MFKIGDKVKITGNKAFGPIKDTEGKVAKINHDRIFNVEVDFAGYGLYPVRSDEIKKC